MTVIALGFKEEAAKGVPKVLYCGADVDEAVKAVRKAGKDKLIAAGQIYRGIEDRVIFRLAFDS
jgi:hypothetical protein